MEGYPRFPSYIYSKEGFQNAWFAFSIIFYFVDISFKYVVLGQPIGKKLFWCYCQSKPALRKLVNFIDLTVSVFTLRFSFI